MWVAAGFAVVAVLAGVIIVIRNRDGTQTKSEVPDRATVEVKKDGRTVTETKPGPQTAPGPDLPP